MPNEVARAIARYRAIRRAERRLLNRLADIDWEIDELQPELDAIRDQATAGELTEVSLVQDGD